MMPKCAKRFTGHGLVVWCPYWSIIWKCVRTYVHQHSWCHSTLERCRYIRTTIACSMQHNYSYSGI